VWQHAAPDGRRWPRFQMGFFGDLSGMSDAGSREVAGGIRVRVVVLVFATLPAIWLYLHPGHRRARRALAQERPEVAA
jgi:hypothetical protein